MVEFLTSQLDYILFFYGFSFFLLIPICLFLRRKSYRKLPWIWLVWFGALHGANEGLDLLALSLEPGPAFDYVRLFVLIMSFVCLAEFGRAGTRSICGRGPGRWILAALVALAGVGGLAGLAGLFATSRYVLGMAGGLWAAGTLFLAAKTEPAGAPPVRNRGSDAWRFMPWPPVWWSPQHPFSRLPGLITTHFWQLRASPSN